MGLSVQSLAPGPSARAAWPLNTQPHLNKWWRGHMNPASSRLVTSTLSSLIAQEWDPLPTGALLPRMDTKYTLTQLTGTLGTLCSQTLTEQGLSATVFAWCGSTGRAEGTYAHCGSSSTWES